MPSVGAVRDPESPVGKRSDLIRRRCVRVVGYRWQRSRRCRLASERDGRLLSVSSAGGEGRGSGVHGELTFAPPLAGFPNRPSQSLLETQMTPALMHRMRRTSESPVDPFGILKMKQTRSVTDIILRVRLGGGRQARERRGQKGSGLSSV